MSASFATKPAEPSGAGREVQGSKAPYAGGRERRPPAVPAGSSRCPVGHTATTTQRILWPVTIRCPDCRTEAPPAAVGASLREHRRHAHGVPKRVHARHAGAAPSSAASVTFATEASARPLRARRHPARTASTLTGRIPDSPQHLRADKRGGRRETTSNVVRLAKHRQGKDGQRARQLATARKAAGLTQQAAAKAIGKSHQSISAYESNRAVPPRGVLEDLGRLYGIRIGAFLDETNCGELRRWPPIAPGIYGVPDPENPQCIVYWMQPHRPSSPITHWPPGSTRPGPPAIPRDLQNYGDRMEYLHAVVWTIFDNPLKARAYFAAFWHRCAACGQPLDESHINDGLHPFCEQRRGGFGVHGQAIRNHVQHARQLLAAGELDPGNAPALQTTR